MPEFNGFQVGCRGEYRHGEVPYISHIAHFQKDGERLTEEQSGDVRPDAVRVVPVDDYEATTYRDVIFAFDEQAAIDQAERGDRCIPEGNIVVIDREDLAEIDHSCLGCDASSGHCVVLEKLTEAAIRRR